MAASAPGATFLTVGSCVVTEAFECKDRNGDDLKAAVDDADGEYTSG